MVAGKVERRVQGAVAATDGEAGEADTIARDWEHSRSSLPQVVAPADLLRVDDYMRLDRYPVPDIYFERGETEFEDLTVQSSVFTSQEFHNLEVKRLWSRVWQMACRENDIPAVGDFYEYVIAGRSILVVRESPGRIKAFFNSCRHRGTAVASGCGNATAFSCPFHGWTYGLDGSLSHLPCGWDFPHVNHAESGLRQCLVDTWDGWVFINMDVTAPPLREFLGEVVPRQFCHPFLTSGKYYKSAHFGAVVGCNWKVMLGAFQETYHGLRTHPQVALGVGTSESRSDTWGLHGRLLVHLGIRPAGTEDLCTEQEVADLALLFAGVSPGTYQVPDGVPARQVVADALREIITRMGVDVSDASDTELLVNCQYHVFPNFLPQGGRPAHVVFRVRPYENDPNQCLFELMMLMQWPEGIERPRDAQMQLVGSEDSFSNHTMEIGLFAPTIDQDIANGPRIQRGIRGSDKIVFGVVLEPLITNFFRNLETWLDISPDRVFEHDT